MTTAAIILAAGSSSRMGKSKQLLDIDGEKLLVKTVQTVLDSGIRNIVVVLGSNESIHRKVIGHLPVDTVNNSEWQKGMGCSIKYGLAHLTAKQPFPDVVILLVCDQPLLRPENIRSLLDKYEEVNKPVIASRYAQVPGVPALFDKTYYQRLLALPDDQGAKKILLQNRQDIFEIDFPEGEIDLDTPDDYRGFRDRIRGL